MLSREASPITMDLLQIMDDAEQIPLDMDLAFGSKCETIETKRGTIRQRAVQL